MPDKNKDKPKGTRPPRIILERRRYVRINASFVLSYIDVTPELSKNDITQTRNISLGGILITTDKQIAVGTVLKLKLKIPAAPTDVEVKVEVVDSKEKVKDLLYETRGRFLALKDEDKNYIDKVVEIYSRPKKRPQKR